MAEAVLLTSLLSSAGAAAGTTAAGASFLGGIGLSSGTLAAVAAGTGAFGSIIAGQQQARAIDHERAQIELDALADRTQAATEEADRQEELRRTLSSQTAIFGRTGIDAGGGSALNIQQQTVSQVGRLSNAERSKTKVRQSQFQSQIKQKRGEARSARIKGFMDAGTSLLNFASMRGSTGKTPAPAPAPKGG